MSKSNTRPDVMTKLFKRDISSLNDVFDYMAAFVDKHAIDEAIAYTLNLVVEEIFTNLVKYDPDAATVIPVELKKDDKGITIELTNNNGHEFNIADPPPIQNDIPLQKRRIGGLGLHLVRHMVDDISYQFTEGTSVIKIVKYLEDGSV